MSESDSLSSESSDSSTSDEAASDPPSPEEPNDPAPAAKEAEKGASPIAEDQLPPKVHKASKKKEKLRSRDDAEFVVSIETLQGRWRHSVASLGMLSVKGNSVSFSDGTRYELKEISPGRIDMDGWQTIQAKSNPEVIVWMLENQPSTIVHWLLEEDEDNNALEGLDSRNIIQGKRQRAKVDYAALEKQIDQEQRQYEDVFSDASSSSGGQKRPVRPEPKGESVEMSPKEWAEHHAKQSKKAANMIRQWMLSTCSSRHEEILRRKGKLQTRIPVILIGPGRKLLEQELLPYAIKVRFQAQETLVIADTNSRKQFQDRHAGDWASSLEKFKLAEKRKMIEKRKAEEVARIGASPVARAAQATPEAVQRQPVAPAAPEVASQETPETESTPTTEVSRTPKKRRLRRVVTSDDEMEVATSENTEGESRQPDQSSFPEVEAPDPIRQAKMKLDSGPPPEEALKELVNLETQNVDHNVLVATKIGVTVNGLRKTYANHPDVVKRATSLVKRWRETWEQFQNQKQS